MASARDANANPRSWALVFGEAMMRLQAAMVPDLGGCAPQMSLSLAAALV
jgi:hypothetical protein